jgi:lipopolysaccharide/colanic/teichoic acid biosynthesis glycosyltransferase
VRRHRKHLQEIQTMKRLFDFLVALAGLIILSPLLAALIILILVTMGWPVFYRQVRVGRGGREFNIIKFRSMEKDADRRGPHITSANDQRITPAGRFLRKFKLDELPQLINVVRGDMSIVGPRPEVPEYVELYTEEQKKVLSVRPGITDMASIEYLDEENTLSNYDDYHRAYVEEIMPAKLRQNLAYIENAGFWGDLVLILKTLRKIFWHR